MRVVILAGEVPSTTFIDALINAMAEEGLELIVVGTQTGEPRYHQNVKTILIPRETMARLLFVLRHLSLRGAKQVGAIFRHRKGIRAFLQQLAEYLPIINASPDRIHIQWAASLHSHHLLFDLFPEKILLSLRGAHINYSPVLRPEIATTHRQLFPRVRAFHAVSNEIAREATKYGAAADRIETIYSFADDALANASLAPQRNDVLSIISVGRFVWVKGYHYALDALALLKSRNIDFVYTLIAQGDIPDELRFQIHQCGLEQNVRIVCGMPHEEVLKTIAASDVLLLTSVQEGVANVVLEAMAVGTPVVTTNCGGMNEVIEDGVNGFIVPTRDTPAISAAIERVAKLSHGERAALVSAAHDTIRRQHNHALFKQGFLRFYSR